jgi:ubiquinone/menaquinone biosynthesis C-methylase UbiE
MDDRDRRALVEPAGLEPGGVWADLGAGTGLFTLCLAAVLGPDGLILAVDRDAAALAELEGAWRAAGGARGLAVVRTRTADYRELTDLPPLDGVLMANSLHYAADLEASLARVVSYLKPAGALLVVEYDTDHANPWVPPPVSFARLAAAAPRSGLAQPRLLERLRSRYHGYVYSSLARPAAAPP